MGYVADLDWFGVPDDHMAFHQGQDDTTQLATFDRDMCAAARALSNDR